MFHGLNNNFLYSAYRIDALFESQAGGFCALMGTGFWVKDEDSPAVLITNRHVIDIAYKNPDKQSYRLKTLRVSGKVKDSDALPSLNQEWVVDPTKIVTSANPHNDIACLVVSQAQAMPTLNAPSTVEFFIPRRFLATDEDFASGIVVCDFLAFPGFPKWHDELQRRPILRTGTIASDPRYNYSGGSLKGQCMAYEAFSYDGSSGSPVFATQKGPKPGPGISFPGFRELKMVGINAGYLKMTATDATHSGISYMYKSSAILDLIDQAISDSQ